MVFFEPVLFEPEVFSSPFFSIHAKTGRFCGLFSEKGRHTEFNAKLRLIFLNGFTMFMIVHFVIGMIYYSATVESFAKGNLTWAAALLFFSITCWVLNIFWKRQDLAMALSFISKDLNNILKRSDNFEEDLLRKTTKSYRFITKGLCIFVTAAAVKLEVDTIVKTIISPDYAFGTNDNSTDPLRIITPYHKISSDFFIVNIWPFPTLLFLTMQLSLVYSFSPSLMSYVSFKLKVLSYRMENMRCTTVMPATINFEKLDEIEKNYWRTKLCESSVVGLNETRWLAEKLESFMRFSIFVDFLTFAIQFCLAFYSIATAEDLFPPFALVFVCSGLLWPYHSQATLILENNDTFKLGIYSCNWYDYPLKLQKLIYTMMFGLHSPITMRAYFVELNLRAFLTILRAGYSYFNVIRRVS